MTLSFDEFSKLSKQYNLIPLVSELPADMTTPLAALAAIGEKDCFLFESVEREEHIGRYSFLGKVSSKKHIFRGKENPFQKMEKMMRAYRAPQLGSLPPFTGGLVGYWGYDTVRWIEKRVRIQKPAGTHFPEAVLFLADEVVAFDHVRRKMIVIVHVPVTRNVQSAYNSGIKRLRLLEKKLMSHKMSPNPRARKRGAHKEWKSNVPNPSTFYEMVRKAKQYIEAGDCIQVVLSQRFSKETHATPFSIYRQLRALNPSPYMFYLDLGPWSLVGSSPEVMVRVNPPKATVRPIAGTRPRGKNEAEDKKLEKELLADAKERAEHVMLVDLGRNDLGRVCKPGSVKVTELMTIERYSHVMHIVSHVEGEIQKWITPGQVLQAAFPAGTVSGAPKVRAMEIIEELEGTRRGPYAGAVGYYSFNGSLDTGIIIRTVLQSGKKCFIQAGAGIVADSSPEQELQEIKNKAAGIIAAVEKAERS